VGVYLRAFDASSRDQPRWGPAATICLLAVDAPSTRFAQAITGILGAQVTPQVALVTKGSDQSTARPPQITTASKYLKM